MTKKRVLILSQSFYPDHSGISNYASDYAFYCAEQGNEVDVVTGFPFYPHWKKKDEDRARLFRKDQVRNVTIHRGYIYVPGNVTTAKRIFHELSLLAFSLLNSFRIERPDVIVVFTTPILLGVLGGILKRVWKSRLVINVQDFQIEAALSLNMFSPGKVIQTLGTLEKWSFRQADFVSSISDSMVELLRVRKEVDDSRLLFWPNWYSDYEKSTKPAAGTGFREEFQIAKGKRIIGYAGNIGKKQGLEILLDLAERLGERSEFIFLIIGEGAGLDALKEYAEGKDLQNLMFLPFLNSAKYQQFLAETDAVFVSQLKVPFDVYFPSKLLGIMAAGKLLIVSADPESELYRTISHNKLGLVSEYGNLPELEGAVRKIEAGSAEIEAYINNARQFVKQFERRVVLDKMNKLFELD